MHKHDTNTNKSTLERPSKTTAATKRYNYLDAQTCSGSTFFWHNAPHREQMQSSDGVWKLLVIQNKWWKPWTEKRVTTWRWICCGSFHLFCVTAGDWWNECSTSCSRFSSDARCSRYASVCWSSLELRMSVLSGSTSVMIRTLRFDVFLGRLSALFR